MHRRAVMAGTAIVSLLCLAGCGSSTPPASAPAEPVGFTHCDYQTTPDQPAPQGHDVGVPPASQSKMGNVDIVLHTSDGDIPLTLSRPEAPCTVASFAYLAQKGFFNSTPCHRLTTSDGLKVLQCGDPTGTGGGGPGYTIPDEDPTTLQPAPAAFGAGVDVYGRGTVAMANTSQPHSGGSQFFLVYADSDLPPAYSVFGSISAAGLQVLDKIASGGIAPGGTSPQDGEPAMKVTIDSAAIGASTEKN